MLFSFVAEAFRRFTCGNGRLVQTLWILGCFPKRSQNGPSEEAYRKACAKVPLKWIAEAGKQSHQHARSNKDKLYEGMRIVLVDGTKIIVPRTDETIKTYGLGSGSTGNAYYPQIHAGGFFDLTTGTFADFNFDHGDPAERQVMLEHATLNQESTLYVSDAGYNGMAHVYLMRETGHHLLMELKMGTLAEQFRKTRKRSAIIEITLRRSHLKNYPKNLIGSTFKIRLIRTKGTTKLRSKVLLTTLLDEKRFKWLDIAKLYLQRWRIELAFRHLKMTIAIEHIRKSKLHRIRQLLWGAIILYNLSATIRNKLKCPTLFPDKEKVKIYCFEFIIQLSELFFLAATGVVTRCKEEIRRRLRAMRNCWFLYAPWRVRPKICQFPASTFTRCKSTERKAEFEKSNAIQNDMKILGIQYGQIEPINP